MGMTIDNSIRILEDSQRWRKKYGIFGCEEDDAINKLMDVAKKYQKIEQIIIDNDNDGRIGRQVRELVNGSN